MKKRHLSFTQLNMLFRCAKQYEYRYILGMVIPPAGPMLQGRAAHEALRHNYRQKITSGRDAPADEMTDVFKESFAGAVKDEPPALDAGDSIEGLAKQGLDLVKLHRAYLSPSVQPARVEEPELVSLGDEFPYALKIIIDVEDADRVLHDNKFASRMPDQFAVDKDLQLSTYLMARTAATGTLYCRAALDVVTRAAHPQAKRIATTRTPEDLLFHLREVVGGAARMITAGAFPPTGIGSFWCSPKMCGYWDRCMGAGRRTIIDMKQVQEEQTKEEEKQ